MFDASDSDNGPWYRNRMLWLVVGIPALTVAGCLLTIYLAITSPDELVSEYSLRNDTGAATER